MTDAALDAAVGSHGGQGWASEGSVRRLRKRHSANRRLQFYGLCAIALAIGLLGTLVSSLVIEGYKAFYQSKATLEIRLDPALIDRDNLADANYRRIFNTAIEQYFPDVKTSAEKRQLADIFSTEARYVLRDYVVAHPGQIGQTIKLSISKSGEIARMSATDPNGVFAERRANAHANPAVC